MLDQFLTFFHCTDRVNETGDLYRDLTTQLGGKDFGGGLLRTFSPELLPRWEAIVQAAFPSFRKKFRIFAYDWQGCIHAVGKDWRGETLYLFDVGADEIMAHRGSLSDFLNREIPERVSEILAPGFFREWQQVSQKPLRHDRCAAYRIPLDYGGTDNISNLEDSDMEVYWSVMTQFRNQREKR